VITSNIEIILIITGALTATMLAQFVAPSWVIRHTFGEIPSGPVSMTLERHWGLLLFCIGTLLVYSAFDPVIRKPAVVLGALEKAGFVVCVLRTSMRQYPIALIMAMGDGLMVLLYVLYLLGL
jgi:hypothetical protein